MLSICIPLYNFEISSLVNALHNEGLGLSFPFEILVVDDGSQEEYKHKNRIIKSLPGVHYMELPHNVGRSRIRNILAKEAKYEWLLFLDCDSLPVNDNFLQSYIPFFKKNTIVVGGTQYQATQPSADKILRWKYGKAREVLPAKKRCKNPNLQFTPNNFLIHKPLFLELGFDEKIKAYGHEDTLFGQELTLRGLQVTHLDNPVFHIGLDPNLEFLNKIKDSVANLLIIDDHKEIKDLGHYVRLWAAYQKVCNWNLDYLFHLFFQSLHPLMEKNLISSRPWIKGLDFYKLGYLCHLKRQKNPDSFFSSAISNLLPKR